MTQDPEFGGCSCGRSTCRCTVCHGDRYVSVSPSYAESHAPMPDLSLLDPAAATLVEAEVMARRKALANSVYPCRVCCPLLFERWAGQHMEPDHDPEACGECSDSRARSTHGRPKRAPLRVPAGPERKDVDG